MSLYYQKAGLEPPRDVATALLIGILTDTSLLTRGVNQVDIGAYADLYGLSNVALVNSILRNKIQEKDLAFYRRSMDNLKVAGGLAFSYLEEGCNQNLLGLLGDFYLSLREVTFVLLCACNDGVINLSARSEEPRWNAAVIMRRIIGKHGSGGGHAHMAGGFISDVGSFDSEQLEHRVREVLGIAGEE
jgi:nanoRNase/pAp phosphatase (c-di-AMP/oligoRNAs hydrolase)